jgi:general secretion pathway protein D
VYFVERNDDPTQVTEFIQLVNVRAADVEGNLANLIGPGSKVITDTDRNLVCLIGRQSDVGAVRRYLHHVDTLKDQVLLEVHIFEVSYEDGFNLGAIADASGTVNGNAWNILSAFGQGSNFTGTLSDDDGDFDLTVDAMRTFVGLELVSSPRVLAVTNTKAMVDVVREIPFVNVTATTTGTTGGAGSVVQEEVQFKDAGIKLEITPSIQEAGFLQIDIVQSTAEEVDRFNDIPVIDKRTLTTQFLVQDRQTIVLGGMIQARHSESRQGVPILMHVPFLGQLFRGDADLRKKQEILVFVTPRIVSPSQAAALSKHYEDSYRESRQDLFFPTVGGSSPIEGPRHAREEAAQDAVPTEGPDQD